MKGKVRVATAVQHPQCLQHPRAEGRRGKGQLRRPAGNKHARQVNAQMGQALPSEAIFLYCEGSVWPNKRTTAGRMGVISLGPPGESASYLSKAKAHRGSEAPEQEDSVRQLHDLNKAKWSGHSGYWVEHKGLGQREEMT